MAPIIEGQRFGSDSGAGRDLPGGSVGRRRRTAGGPAHRGVNVGLLALFLLFTTVLGVERADAKWDWRAVTACAGACTILIGTQLGALGCAGCLADAAIRIESTWLGDDRPYGFACAKANIGC